MTRYEPTLGVEINVVQVSYEKNNSQDFKLLYITAYVDCVSGSLSSDNFKHQLLQTSFTKFIVRFFSKHCLFFIDASSCFLYHFYFANSIIK